MTEIKRFGSTRLPSEFIGLQAEKVAKTDNVVGDVFYVSGGAGKLLNASVWNGTAWDMFEVYDV